MRTNLKDKYIKYKKKYIILKKQRGGNPLQISESMKFNILVECLKDIVNSAYMHKNNQMYTVSNREYYNGQIDEFIKKSNELDQLKNNNINELIIKLKEIINGIDKITELNVGKPGNGENFYRKRNPKNELNHLLKELEKMNSSSTFINLIELLKILSEDIKLDDSSHLITKQKKLIDTGYYFKFNVNTFKMLLKFSFLNSIRSRTIIDNDNDNDNDNDSNTLLHNIVIYSDQYYVYDNVKVIKEFTDEIQSQQDIKDTEEYNNMLSLIKAKTKNKNYTFMDLLVLRDSINISYFANNPLSLYTLDGLFYSTWYVRDKLYDLSSYKQSELKNDYKKLLPDLMNYEPLLELFLYKDYTEDYDRRGEIRKWTDTNFTSEYDRSHLRSQTEINKWKTVLHTMVLEKDISLLTSLPYNDKNYDVFNGTKNDSGHRFGLTPLQLAVRENEKPENKGSYDEIIKLLIEKGASIGVRYDDSGLTILQEAINKKNYKYVETLLEYKKNYGSALDTSSSNTPKYYTALMLAIKHIDDNDETNKEIIKLLIKKGANINKFGGSAPVFPSFYNPLHFAFNQGKNKIVKLLIEQKADINAQFTTKKLTLKEIKTSRDDKIWYNSYGVEHLNGFTLLHYVVSSNDSDLVDFVLKHGADVKLTDPYSKTALHILKNINLKVDNKIFDLLISKGLDINAQDVYGKTKLHYAIEHMNYEHADDKKNMIKLLLSKGADVSILTSEYLSSLMLAIMVKDIETAQLLIDKVDVNAQYTGKYTIEEIDKMEKALSKKEYVNIIHGSSALHTAVITNNIEAVELLLSNKANINITNSFGKTALHLISEMKYQTDPIIIDLLASNKDIDFDIKDVYGKTIIDYANEDRRFNFAEYIKSKIKS